MEQFDYGKRAKLGVIDKVPPMAMKRGYAVLVPALDADGNEAGGLRLPEQAVPAATTTGWSLRSDQAGGAGELCYLDGFTAPFPATAAAREAAKDPRQSLAERYGDREKYAAKVREAALELEKGGYLLAEDIDGIVERAAKNANFENGH
jgi:hypothetical protein